MHDLDICECGDYRRDHKGGTGACIFNGDGAGDGHFGAGRCNHFKLSQYHSNNTQVVPPVDPGKYSGPC